MGTQLAQVQRTGRIVQVLVRHGLFGLLEQLRRGDASAAERFGQRLARVLDDLGPTFVKIGQILATREDIVPASVAAQLASLQDGSAPIPSRVARAEVERALGKRISEMFVRFDDHPLATGSIAQVHRARTVDAHDVVVKVRRPGIDRILEADLELLVGACSALQARIPELERYDPVGLAEELGRGLREELDLLKEAESTERMRAILGADGRVPRVYHELSAKTVLTLEFIRGSKLADLAEPEARRKVARQMVGGFAAQLLVGDLFHADPHAGNLVLMDDGSLTMLDLGAVGRLTPEMRRVLKRISWAATRRNADSLAIAALDLTCAPPTLDRARYREDMRQALAPILDRPLNEVDIPTMMAQVLEVSRRHNLRLRSEYFLLFRAMTLVDGVLRKLDPKMDPVGATTRHILARWYRPRWFLPALTVLLVTVLAGGAALIRGAGRLLSFKRRRLTAGGGQRAALPPTVGPASACDSSEP